MSVRAGIARHAHRPRRPILLSPRTLPPHHGRPTHLLPLSLSLSELLLGELLPSGDLPWRAHAPGHRLLVPASHLLPEPVMEDSTEPAAAMADRASAMADRALAMADPAPAIPDLREAAAALSNMGMFVVEMSNDSYQLLGMAERGMLPAFFARRSRHGTPLVGILFWASGVLLLSTLRRATATSPAPCLFLLGVVPFPSDVPRLKQLGVRGVVTLNEPYETLVPTSLYQANQIEHLVIPTRDYLFAPSLKDISQAIDFIHPASAVV